MLLGALVLSARVAVHAPSGAAAHPLGNFTVNRYARVEIGAGQVRVRYVVDMAEIPTFQEISNKIDRNHDGLLSNEEKDAYLAKTVAGLLSGLQVVVNGRPVPLGVESDALAFSPGQGGLQTLRIEGWFRAPFSPGGDAAVGHIEVKDGNYKDRAGWREVLLRAVGGVTLSDTGAATQDVSNELRNYPQDALATPLNRSSAGTSFRVDAAAESSAAASEPAHAQTAAAPSGSAIPQTEAGFTKLITRSLTGPAIVLAVLAAMAFGGLHAMGPGHGKTIVAAYLVGSRGTARHAVFLGLTVTITHTIGVFALGLITIGLSQYILPERLYPWLSLSSGVIVAVMGLTLLISRLKASRRRARGHGGEHGHVHASDAIAAHSHDEGAHAHGDATPDRAGTEPHSHTVPGADGTRITWRSLLALGISGGILPCPSALVVLLTAISLHRVGLGLLLILAFSFGLAAVLTGFGLLLIFAGRAFRWLRTDSRVLRLLPVGSAFVVLIAGIMITAQTLPQAGALHP
jgi:ABC-type nickel/cobalt efflux system permease component RcnA